MNDSDPAIFAKICELLQAFNKKGWRSNRISRS